MGDILRVDPGSMQINSDGKDDTLLTSTPQARRKVMLLVAASTASGLLAAGIQNKVL